MRSAGISRALSAPTGGWDTREALADMPPQNAVQLDNWFPSTDKVTTRPGSAQFVSGIGAPVESLLFYTPLSGDGELFAAAGADIYDVTGGSLGSAVVTGAANARWQQVQIGTAGGQFLFICNGADTPQTYDGATWDDTTITGPTVTSLIWCNTHNRRLWVGEVDSLAGWYLPVNTIGGAASKFSIAGVCRLGGYIMAMGTGPRDSGDGPADLAVFVTSEGEVVVYQGIDPNDVDLWDLAGVYRIGRPIGRRCMVKSASDLIIITEDGFVALSSILTLDRTQAQNVALSAQVARAVNDAVRANGTRFGWQPVLYPRSSMLLFNVPTGEETAQQIVFNTITGAPCRFTGLNALCWAVVEDTAYFGDANGVVWTFDTATTDAGAGIACTALQAYNYFGDPARVKRFGHIEPIFESLAQPNAQADVAVDFRLPSVPAPQIASAGNMGVALWGVALWGVSTWGGATEIWNGWRGARGVGRAAAVRVVLPAAEQEVAWIATNIQMQPGGAF